MKKRVLMILSLVLFLTVVSCDDDYAEIESIEIETIQATDPVGEEDEEFPPGGGSTKGEG